MRIAYVTSYSAGDVNNWSGLGYHIAQSLENQGMALDFVGPLQENFRLVSLAKKCFFRGLFRKRYLRDRDRLVVRDYARQVAGRLAALRVDVVFSPGTLPIAYLDCKEPIAFWTDATFGEMIDFYPGASNLTRQTVADGMATEQAALDRARLAIYSSEWAAQSAGKRYRVDPTKLKVVPFGANIECHRTSDEVKSIIDSRPVNRCKLLFLAVDWIRKGGEIACQIARRLNEMGLAAELRIVGCNPPQPEALPPFIHCEGFVSKATLHGRQRISALLSESHFLILPSRADCTPVVLPEANSFGVPCITTNVGGIPTIVRDGFNGRAFELNASSDDYCGYISALMSHYEEYRRLALSSFNEYQTRLNWSVAGRTVGELLQGIAV